VELQVVPVDDDTVGLRITGAATSPAANLLEIGTTGSPTNFRVERTGNLVTAGAVNAGGTITFGALGGAASGSLGGNDRIVLANGSGRLAQVSPSALIANVGWSLFGNTLTDETSGGFGEVPVGRYLGTNDAIDLRFVTGGRVRATPPAATVEAARVPSTAAAPARATPSTAAAAAEAAAAVTASAQARGGAAGASHAASAHRR
jgi:hypothetical protein